MRFMRVSCRCQQHHIANRGRRVKHQRGGRPNGRLKEGALLLPPRLRVRRTPGVGCGPGAAAAALPVLRAAAAQRLRLDAPVVELDVEAIARLHAAPNAACARRLSRTSAKPRCSTL